MIRAADRKINRLCSIDTRPIFWNTLESPKATNNPSAAITTREKKSREKLRSTKAPMGTPMSTGKRRSGTKPREVGVKSPKARYAMEVKDASATRTWAMAHRNSPLEVPWLRQKIARGGPEMVVR